MERLEGQILLLNHGINEGARVTKDKLALDVIVKNIESIGKSSKNKKVVLDLVNGERSVEEVLVTTYNPLNNLPDYFFLKPFNFGILVAYTQSRTDYLVKLVYQIRDPSLNFVRSAYTEGDEFIRELCKKRPDFI